MASFRLIAGATLGVVLLLPYLVKSQSGKDQKRSEGGSKGQPSEASFYFSSRIRKELRRIHATL